VNTIVNSVKQQCTMHAVQPAAQEVIRPILSRVLEACGCASVCANVCKAPTQDFFTHGVGLPLTMVPDYETQSCTLIFGASPPPLAEDEAFMQQASLRTSGLWRLFRCDECALSLNR